MSRLLITCVLSFLLLGTSPLAAQSVWTGPPDHTDQVSVEWLKPVFDDGGEVSFFTSSVLVSGQATVSERLSIVGELPISYARTEAANTFGETKTASSTTVGNPYLGIELWGRSMPFFLELGMRMPAVDDPAFFSSAVGTLTDLNRVGTFVVDQVPVQLVGNYHYALPSPDISFRIRGGTETFFPAGEKAPTGTMILTYGAQAWYHGTSLVAGLGFTGRWRTTGRDTGFREGSFHQISAVLQGAFGGVRPGLIVRVPMEKVLRDVLPVVAGVTMTIDLSGGETK
jgi:hypothetical protein